jgi:hypothetical protein
MLLSPVFFSFQKVQDIFIVVFFDFWIFGSRVGTFAGGDGGGSRRQRRKQQRVFPLVTQQWIGRRSVTAFAALILLLNFFFRPCKPRNSRLKLAD